MTNQKNKNIIMLNGRKSEEQEELSQLIVEGETHDLRSFIISGETPEGKRLIFTWNASLDEMLSYNYVLNICIEDKVRNALHQ